uniref:ABC transporter ATP-binding protein n=1 Tax=Algoriphagus sp. TaxID=1872435 RepID=UPI00404899EB
MVSIRKTATIRSIFSDFLASHTKHFSLLLILLVIQGIIASLSLLAIVPIADFLFDSALKNHSGITGYWISFFNAIHLPVNFWTLGGQFIILNILKGLMEVSINYAVLKIKYAIIRGLVGEAFSTFFKARWKFFSSSNNGQLLNTLNKEIITIGDAVGHLATIFANIIQVCILLSVPLWLNATMTITTIGLTGILAIPFLLLKGISYRYGKANTETANVAMGVLNEALQAARLILGFGMQKKERERYLSAFDNHTYVTLRSQTLTSGVSYLFRPLAMLAAIIAMGFAIQRGSPISELAAVLWSLLAAMPIFASLIQGRVSINSFLPSYDQLNSLKDRAAEFEEIEGSSVFSQLTDGIEFKNVSFTYPGRTKTINKINLRIQKGSMTALVGESGSGKSTITDILLGLQVPDEGEVLIDNKSLNDLKQNSFRKRIGYVPQDSLLFHDSIRQNLLWAYDQANEEDLWTALHLANAEEFVKELPQGIDTMVGDRGVRLSGGQRQRIALARALLRKPDLLILDEATSSLDSESEQLIQLSIEQIAHNTTILIVAHRLSTIAKANQVYVLSNGEIIEEGSFNVLSNKNGGVLNGMLLKQVPVEKNQIL